MLILKNLAERLFFPGFGFFVFVLFIGVTYCIIPFFLFMFFSVDEFFIKLSGLTFFSIIILIVGYFTPLIDGQFSEGARRIVISSSFFNSVVWAFFLVFAAYTFYTAQSIPLYSALLGASADALSQERGDFFKGRTGAESMLLYLSTIFTTVLIPYSLVLMYRDNNRYRHFLFLMSFAFCVSFLQKALFLNIFLPVLVCFAITGRLSLRMFLGCLFGIPLILVAAVFLSLGDASTALVSEGVKLDYYFSSKYLPVGGMDYLFWRIFAVPLFTATDTLLVHSEIFKGEFLMGATSTLLSLISGMDRINIERYVFQHQFGSWNEIANANAVFVSDAYVNFGWVGIFCFSFLIGQVFRWFRLSSDIAFKSLWPVFALTLYSASLIGMLMSNGFLYILFHALFLRIYCAPR
ncbi:hypothetical protein M2262_002171 [Pseudomonas sp. BIGb0408]|uniref:Oligosaccharide repeat unit polymerase n=1 Tax=Phytopseudomonas flavescens TaxID=29435 RepID=A0A7Y9XNM3_9GAMM|nr:MULTISPECIES: hypothetical protein [Pseudomonas]MCW2292121.1 hypothetical protein [Pseudomonas sp. BIGb0408]NYH73307.1 hypothetical protein [Pseudomonas flavescens]